MSNHFKNSNLERLNMVQNQVRPFGVLDQKILDLMLKIPRESFVLPEYQHLAYADACIPIGFQQVSLTPKFIGRMLQTLNLDARESILEIGTGTGYITALLAHLVKEVQSIEIIAELAHAAKANMNNLGLHNISLEIGNGVLGLPDSGPFDAIIYTGSLPAIPTNLENQLKSNGKIFAVLGVFPLMKAVMITYNNMKYTQQDFFETEIPPLKGIEPIKHFEF